MTVKHPSRANDIQRPGGPVHIPPGRALDQVPKGDPIPAPDGRVKPKNFKTNLRLFITKEESQNYLIPFLKEMGAKRKKGPWRGYLEFYTANHSGDLDTMNPTNRAYCEKMRDDLVNEYFEQQDL